MKRIALVAVTVSALILAMPPRRAVEAQAEPNLPVLPADSPYVSSAEPPERYRRGPNGLTLITVAFLPADAVNATCQRLGGFAPPSGMVFAGCVWRPSSQPPVMILANPCESLASRQERIQCHEIAHANGWAGDHPQ